MKILIVENDVVQGESLALILRNEGYTAYYSPSSPGSQAISEVHEPDAVILDLHLAGAPQGRDFLRWLRSRPPTAGVPIIVSTGSPPDDVKDLEGLPSVAILHKPYSLDVLLGTLERFGVRPLHAVTAGGGAQESLMRSERQTLHPPPGDAARRERDL